MKILIVGAGGREHAIAWKLRQSTKKVEIFVAPGNPGTATIAQNIELEETSHIVGWSKKNSIDLVIIGSERYLAEGIVDQLREKNIKVFGPSRAAAEIEWSKSYAKQMMNDEGIPTANSKIFNDIAAANAYVQHERYPLVIKASGLASGKGVVIAQDSEMARKVLHRMMCEKIFGDAGQSVVIEEYLVGREISVHAVCDKTHAIIFPPAQDHKQIFDGGLGENTGGMGTIAPVPWVSDYELVQISEKIILPTLQALQKRGRAFSGLLFPGIMLTQHGPKVIEYNTRFGDPETQVYMQILRSDLLELILASVEGKIAETRVEWGGAACCVILASEGYPNEIKKGQKIFGIEEGEKVGAVVFHAATKTENGGIVTNGGRVLGITTHEENLNKAIKKTYKAIENIFFQGMHYRKDIGASICNE